MSWGSVANCVEWMDEPKSRSNGKSHRNGKSRLPHKFFNKSAHRRDQQVGRVVRALNQLDKTKSRVRDVARFSRTSTLLEDTWQAPTAAEVAQEERREMEEFFTNSYASEYDNDDDDDYFFDYYEDFFDHVRNQAEDKANEDKANEKYKACMNAYWQDKIRREEGENV